MDLHRPAATDRGKLGEQVASLVEYFDTNVGCHGLYGKHFLFCVFFNLLNLIAQVIFKSACFFT